jgi:NADH:ubiquinone oxidoreductase subunit 5 (subunit L)/multisubunit Na+/H+ antiporter MnhA subunit
LAYSIESNPLVNDFSVLLLFLTIIIHFYSYVYFKKDPELGRFSILLGLFVFSMLLMINSTSFIFVFIAWEGVGLFSFLLVAFWHTKVSTFKSGIKVLFYNRFGDFFFFLIIGLVINFFKTDHIGTAQSLSVYLDGYSVSFYGQLSLKLFLSFCLTIVILSKSAQYGFHIWLLEAMEAPLPASALIHSATLICSGVVLFFKAPEIICNQAEVSSLLML